MGYRRQYNIKMFGQSSGDINGIWNDGLSLRYTRKMNDVGMCVWAVRPDHPALSLLDEDDRIEVAVTNDNSDGDFFSWDTDFYGVYREKQTATDQIGNEYALLYFPSAEEVLSRSIVAYKAGTNNRSAFTSVGIGSIFSIVWRYNCTTLGTTADGRIRDAVSTLSTTGSGTGNASLIDYRCAWKSVLTAMQELAALGSDTFEVVRNSSTNALTVQVNINNTDKSSDVVFSTALNNIGQASLSENKLLEKTVAVVGGAGEESARTVVARTGTNQSATNNYEIFVDHKDTSTTAILDDRGDIALSVRQARPTIIADVLQSSGYKYLADYELGNLVTLDFGGLQVTRQVSQVDVAFDPYMRVDISLSEEI